MKEIVFIGDELSAMAYRLAGIRVVTIAPENTVRTLDEEVSNEVSLILLGALHAQFLDPDELTRRIRLAAPPLMVVSDAAGKTTLPDFVTLLRHRLGVAP